MELTDMEALKAAGACGFTDDGIPLRDAAFLYKAMVKAGELDVPISLHEEDPSFIKNNGINHGPVSDRLGNIWFTGYCRGVAGRAGLHACPPLRSSCCDPAYQFRTFC